MTVLLLLLTTLACTTGELYVPEWTGGLPAADGGEGSGGDPGGGTGGDPGGGTGGDPGGGTGGDPGGGTGGDDNASEIDDINSPEDVPCGTGDEMDRTRLTVVHESAEVPVDVWASLEDCTRILVQTLTPPTTVEYEVRVGDAYVFSYDDPDSGEQIDFMYVIVGDDAPTVVLE